MAAMSLNVVLYRYFAQVEGQPASKGMAKFRPELKALTTVERLELGIPAAAELGVELKLNDEEQAACDTLAAAA